jgi:tetratricopeptide (TPR) repeat protein
MCAQKSPQMGCVTCHSPHAAKPVDADQACMNCHTEQVHAKLTPPPITTDKTKCVSCHMRKEGLRNIPHLSTLDHWIRRVPTPEPVAQNSDAKLIWIAHPTENPSQPDHQLLLGRAYYKAWRQAAQVLDLERAYIHLTNALPERLQATQAWITLAELSAEVSVSGILPALKGEVGYRIAIDAAERAYQLDPNRWQIVFLLSELYVRGRRFDAALQILNHHQRLDPHRGELQRRRAQILRTQGKISEANVAIKAALTTNIFDVHAHFEWGLLIQSQQKWSQARKIFTSLLGLEPQWREAWLNLAWIEFQDQKYADALRAFRKASEVWGSTKVPQHIQAQSLAGQALSLEWLGALNEAQELANQAIQFNLSLPGVYALLGRVALVKQQNLSAQSFFQKATNESPNDGLAWWGLAQAQVALGNKSVARKSAQRAVDLGIAEAKIFIK